MITSVELFVPAIVMSKLVFWVVLSALLVKPMALEELWSPWCTVDSHAKAGGEVRSSIDVVSALMYIIRPSSAPQACSDDP